MGAALIMAQAARQRALQAAAAASEQDLGPDLMPNDELAVVRLRRRVYGGGAAVPWSVFVDGECAGILRLGERCQFYVYPGHHQLEVRSNAWNMRDAAMPFDAAAGEVVAISCALEARARLRRAIVFEREATGRIVGNRPLPSG